MLRTSLNMKHAVFMRIGFAAARLGTTRREIVLLLLRRIMHDINHFQGGFTLVRYSRATLVSDGIAFPFVSGRMRMSWSRTFVSWVSVLSRIW
jgi:hypothetical protein